jgi:6-phosphogluconate dehydrogenase (decarboxylating)
VRHPSPTSCRNFDFLPLLETGDILIDGGNSHYVDDIPRAPELCPERTSLYGRGNEWRRMPTTTSTHNCSTGGSSCVITIFRLAFARKRRHRAERVWRACMQ